MGVADQRCIKVSPIKLIMQYRFAPPKTLKTCRVPELLRNRSFVQTVYSDPPFPSWRMILDRSSPSRVRSAAFRALDRSGPIRRGWLFTRRKGGYGFGPCPGRKVPFGHIRGRLRKRAK